jgi:prepilin-type N-terminal cleavage/methylation domain-containing protein
MQIMQNYKWQQIRNKGFTLVESLVAVSILSLSILSTFTAVQGGLQSSNYAKDQMVAYYLAQEAMEYIKNVRDQNALASLGGTPVNWLTGLSAQVSDPCYFGEVCTIDSYTNTISGASPCTTAFGSCPNLNQNSVTGLYGYTSGTNWSTTNFKREIKLTQNSVNTEITVTINISWTTKGVPHTFQVSQLIFNRG